MFTCCTGCGTKRHSSPSRPLLHDRPSLTINRQTQQSNSFKLAVNLTHTFLMVQFPFLAVAFSQVATTLTHRDNTQTTFLDCLAVQKTGLGSFDRARIVRGVFRPGSQTPQLAECQWLIALMSTTWRKRYRSVPRYKKKG